MTDNTQTEALLPSRETLMAQAQVFASAWAIAGSSFDSGDGMEVAEQEKAILADMTRRLHARIAELEAQIEALSGVQALSAAPAVPAGWKAVPVNPTPEMWKAAKTVPDPNPPYPPHYGLVWDAMLAASPTPPAEQQAQPGAVYAGLPERRRVFLCTKCGGRECESGSIHQTHPPCKCGYLGFAENLDFTEDQMRDFADRTHALRMEQGAPKAAPGEPGWWRKRADEIEVQVALTGSPEAMRCYTDMRTLLQAAAGAAPQQEAQEPVATVIKKGADRQWMSEKLGAFPDGIYNLYLAPQPAPAPVSEMPYEKRKAIQEGEQIGASDAWFHARHNMLDTLDRRNVFRAGFDRGWNAALAAQGGKDA